MARRACKSVQKCSSRSILVAGLDPSLTGTAICFMSGAGVVDLVITFTVPGNGLQRILAIEDKLTMLLKEKKPDVVYIEGFSFASKGRAVYDTGMLGGVIRRRLFVSKFPCVEVPPTVLKKFICGKGNVNKNVMLEQTFRRYGIGSESLVDDNQVDAYGLAQFARAHTGHEPSLTKAQREVLEKVERWDVGASGDR